MIRRWSRLNNFNFFFDYSSYLLTRFEIFKLQKAINFKKFNFGITRFTRHKLAKWKRHSTWLPYIEVFKYWIKDYNFFKRLAKSQFSDTFFLNSIFVYNFFFIKKKNILNPNPVLSHTINTFSRTFFYYFLKKNFNNRIFLFLSGVPNTNFVSINSPHSLQILENNDSINLAIRSENILYSPNLNFYKHTALSFFFTNIVLKQILYTYKIFVFFFTLINFVF